MGVPAERYCNISNSSPTRLSSVYLIFLRTRHLPRCFLSDQVSRSVVREHKSSVLVALPQRLGRRMLHFDLCKIILIKYSRCIDNRKRQNTVTVRTVTSGVNSSRRERTQQVDRCRVRDPSVDATERLSTLICQLGPWPRLRKQLGQRSLRLEVR